MYVFNSPTGPAPALVGLDKAADESSHGTLTLGHLRTMVHTLPPARRDPTALAFEIVVSAGIGSEEQEWSLKLCAKDEASRTKWLKHVRSRAMGPLALKRLGLLGGVSPTSPKGPLR